MSKPDTGTDCKTRILLVIRWPVGGIRTFVRYVYNNLDPSQYHLTVLAPDIPELKVMIDDLKGFDVSCKTFPSGASALSIAYVVGNTILFGRFDLIHSQGFTAGLYSALPARIKRVRHIMTSHDILSKTQFNGVAGYSKKKTLSFLLPKIDIIHSVSNDAQTNLLEFIPVLKKRNNCIIITNGIEIGRFNGSGKMDLRKELKLAGDTFLIGFMGRFMSQKGFVYLMEAMEKLHNDGSLSKRPVVIAFGSGGFVRETKRSVIEKKLEDSIYFMPFTADSSAALKGFDVLAMPSLWEACPLLPMEAMVAGVPVIGSDCIGLREVLKDTPSVVVPAANGDALAKAIANEIRNPSGKRAEEFKEEAASRFDVKKQASALETVFAGLLANKAAARRALT